MKYQILNIQCNISEGAAHSSQKQNSICISIYHSFSGTPAVDMLVIILDQERNYMRALLRP